MPSTDLNLGAPYRHSRLHVATPPRRTRRRFVLAAALALGGFALAPPLVPATVDHPVDRSGVPIAPHVVRFTDGEVEPLRDVIAFAANRGSLIAVRADGRAFDLDSNDRDARNVAVDIGPWGRPPWTDGPREVHGIASNYLSNGEAVESCLLSARDVPAWEPGQRTFRWPSDSPYSSGRRDCRRDEGGRVLCRNLVANGRVNRRDRPRPVASSLRFTHLVALDGITCGLTTTREVACWGPAVRLVPGIEHARALTLREREACALTAEGEVWCWNPSAPNESFRRKGLAPAVELVADGTATCARTAEGAVSCWGVIRRAWPGHPRVERAVRPLDLRMPAAVGSVEAVSRDVFCARLHNGERRCFGGTEDHWAATRPTARLGDTPPDESWIDATAIAPASRLLADGRVRVPDERQALGFSVLGDLPRSREVVESDRHACALALDGRAWCWGDNYYGQLGLDDTIADGDWRVVQIARR